MQFKTENLTLHCSEQQCPSKRLKKGLFKAKQWQNYKDKI